VHSNHVVHAAESCLLQNLHRARVVRSRLRRSRSACANQAERYLEMRRLRSTTIGRLRKPWHCFSSSSISLSRKSSCFFHQRSSARRRHSKKHRAKRPRRMVTLTCERKALMCCPQYQACANLVVRVLG
jgi:hypothetical protein